MPPLNITHAVATDMSSWGSQSAITPSDTDMFGDQKESTYMNDLWTSQWETFQKHPEMKQ